MKNKVNWILGGMVLIISVILFYALTNKPKEVIKEKEKKQPLTEAEIKYRDSIKNWSLTKVLYYNDSIEESLITRIKHPKLVKYAEVRTRKSLNYLLNFKNLEALHLKANYSYSKDKLIDNILDSLKLLKELNIDDFQSYGSDFSPYIINNTTNSNISKLSIESNFTGDLKFDGKKFKQLQVLNIKGYGNDRKKLNGNFRNLEHLNIESGYDGSLNINIIAPYLKNIFLESNKALELKIKTDSIETLFLKHLEFYPDFYIGNLNKNTNSIFCNSIDKLIMLNCYSKLRSKKQLAIIEIPYFTSLKKITLSDNYGFKFDAKNLNKLLNCESLYLDGDFKNLPKNLSSLKKLKKLSLRLDKPISFSGLDSLESASINYNYISKPIGIEKLKRLTYLDLNLHKCNNLNWLSNLNQLKELHISIGSFDQLESLYSIISKMDSLEVLSISIIDDFRKYDYDNSIDSLRKLNEYNQRDSIENIFETKYKQIVDSVIIKGQTI